MFSYTFINSHSQVSNPGPKGPLVCRMLIFIISSYFEKKIRNPVSMLNSLQNVGPDLDPDCLAI